LRAIAHERIRAGEALPPIAMKTLASYGIHAEKTARPDIAATLAGIRDELQGLRAEVRTLAERIAVLLPEDVLIERAKALSRHENCGYFGSLAHLLANLRRKYNPVNLSDLRHAVSRAECDAAHA